MDEIVAALDALLAAGRYAELEATSRGVLARPVGVIGSMGGVAVTGEIDGNERALQRQAHGVPRVRVLCASVEQHQLGRARTPAQRAH